MANASMCICTVRQMLTHLRRITATWMFVEDKLLSSWSTWSSVGRVGRQRGSREVQNKATTPFLYTAKAATIPNGMTGWIHNSPFTTRLFITFNKNSRCTTTIHLTAHGSRSRSRFTSRLTITFTTKFSTFSSFSFGGILKWNPPNLRIFYPFSLVTVALAQLISTLVCFLGTPLFPPSHSQCGRHCPHTFCCLSATRPLIANRILFGMTIDKRCMICFFFAYRRSSIAWLITWKNILIIHVNLCFRLVQF